MKIVNKPNYKIEFEENGALKTFDYNCVAGLVPANITFQSEQATVLSISSIVSAPDNTSVALAEDLTSYLNHVTIAKNGHPTVYIKDRSGKFPDYSGSYSVYSVKAVSGGGCILTIASENGDPVFQSNKNFSNDCDLFYRYKHRAEVVYKDRTVYGKNAANDLVISTIDLPFQADGSLVVNLSEVSRARLGDVGALGLQAIVTEKDFKNAAISTVTSEIVNLVPSSYSQKNYGSFTAFNPATGGYLLPSTHDRIYYDDNKIQPFFLNFVCNENIFAYNNNTVLLHAQSYDVDNNYLDGVEIDISPLALCGLNSIDISEPLFFDLLELVRNTETNYLNFFLSYSGSNGGQFASSQYSTTQFLASTDFYQQKTAVTKVQIEYKNFYNPRDFYVIYRSGYGGKSSLLFESYTMRKTNELSSIRNAYQLKNSVSRAQEFVDLSLRYLDLSRADHLIGYDLQNSVKESGIYECDKVQRVDEFGVISDWLVEDTSYNMENSTSYKDVSITLSRPDYDSNTSVPNSQVKIISASTISATEANLIVQILPYGSQVAIKKSVLCDGRNFTTLDMPSQSSGLLNFLLTGLTAGTRYTAVAKITTSAGESISSPFIFKL